MGDWSVTASCEKVGIFLVEVPDGSRATMKEIVLDQVSIFIILAASSSLKWWVDIALSQPCLEMAEIKPGIPCLESLGSTTEQQPC